MSTEAPEVKPILEEQELKLYNCLLEQDHLFGEKFGARITFSETGRHRLCQIAGFLLGLKLCGKEALAQELFKDFYKRVSWLNPPEKVKYEFTPHPKEFPDHKVEVEYYPTKVILSDDRSLFGFSVMWYMGITQDRMNELKTEKPARYEALMKGSQTEQERRLYKASPGATDYSTYFIYYPYQMNGGLLFHGFGNDPGSILVSAPGQKVWWSTHT